MENANLWTFLAVLIGGGPALIAALAAFIQSIRTGKKTDLVHEIVNQQRADMEAKIKRLEDIIAARLAADVRQDAAVQREVEKKE